MKHINLDKITQHNYDYYTSSFDPRELVKKCDQQILQGHVQESQHPLEKFPHGWRRE